MDEYRKSRIAEGVAGVTALVLVVGGVSLFFGGMWHHNLWMIAGGLVAVPMGYALGCLCRM